LGALPRAVWSRRSRQLDSMGKSGGLRLSAGLADIRLQFGGCGTLNLSDLEGAGFDVQTENHALAVLTKDFSGPLGELCDALMEVRISDVELIRGGGGEANSTQCLRRSLSDRDWLKRNIVIRKIVNGAERAAISHEIDHVRRINNGAVALEIEWNNKDPFFDRDLKNFQRLHSEGAISVGVIVTRGKSLQQNLVQIVMTCAINHGVSGFDDLARFGLNPTLRQRRMVKGEGDDFVADWARRFVQDKFGNATTHWDKLSERIERGVGTPCPLLSVGIPAASVYRNRVDEPCAGKGGFFDKPVGLPKTPLPCVRMIRFPALRAIGWGAWDARQGRHRHDGDRCRRHGRPAPPVSGRRYRDSVA